MPQPTRPTPDLTVHHLNNSRSQRILWLLEELALPYDIKRYQRDPKTQLAPKELLAVHPLGKSPVVTDGPVTLAESGAIVEYILNRHSQGRLLPALGSPERLRFTFWMHFAEGSAMPPQVFSLILDAAGKRAPFFARPIAKAIAAAVHKGYLDPTVTRQLDYMEAELEHGPWFAGAELTGADIMMIFPVEAASARFGLGDRPRLKAWLQAVHSRPAWTAALDRGGPYALA
jgi:glutathione S-transferase